MRIRLFITALLLIALLLFLNRAAGRYLSAMVSQQLDMLAGSNQQMQYNYDRLKINPAFGSLTIEELTFLDDENRIFMKEVTGSLTYADIWRVMRKRSLHPADQIRSFRIQIYKLDYYRSPAGISGTQLFHDPPIETGIRRPASFENTVQVPGFSIKDLHLIYNGRMDELLEILESRQLPEYNHRINLNVKNLHFKDSEWATAWKLPVLSGYHFPEKLDQAALQIHYLADQKKAYLSTVRVLSRDLVFLASGDVAFNDGPGPAQPDFWNLEYSLEARTHELAKLPISPLAGGFSMDTLSIKSRVTFVHEEAGNNPLMLPGWTSLYLGEAWWYPSPALAEQYRLFFGLTGISDQKLPIESLQAEWENAEGGLTIQNTVLSTIPFDALCTFVIDTPDGLPANIQKGEILFTRTNAAFNDFIDGFEGFFRIDLPRRDGQVYLEISGDPRSPDFHFLNNFEIEGL